MPGVEPEQNGRNPFSMTKGELSSALCHRSKFRTQSIRLTRPRCDEWITGIAREPR